MRVLLDENLPRGLKRELTGHEVITVPEIGWSGMTDADLLRRASTHFDALITADRSIEYQHNVAVISIGIIVVAVRNTRLQTLRPVVPAILAALETISSGSVVQVGVP